MKKLLFLFILLCSISLYSQNTGTIKGNIIDLEANGEPLLFADVQLKDSNWHTQTNFNGNFELAGIDAGNYILEVNFLGYETLEVPLEVSDNQITRIDKGMAAKTLNQEEFIKTTSQNAMKTIASTEKEE